MASDDIESRPGSELIDIIEVSETKLKYLNRQYKKVPSKMYDYNCDVKLIVGNETFKAHRDVLEEASDYFSAMFTHNMQEKENNVIELKEISPLGFTAMIEYFYHGYVTIDTLNIQGVLEAARFFHIEWLIAVCRHYLVFHLSVEDYQAVLQLADAYYLGVDDVKTKIFINMCDNFLQLAVKPRFLRVQYELLHQLLGEDHCVQASEGFIFNSVQHWLDHDPESRQQHRTELLRLIRYPLLETDELEAVDESILAIPEIAPLVEEARAYLCLPSRQCLLGSDKTEARGSKDFLVLYSGIEDDNRINYKSSEGSGFLTEALDTSFLQVVFEFSSVAVLGNFVFVAGGYGRDRWCSSSAFYRYSPHSHRWVELSCMQQPRVSFPLCPSNKILYAVTGVDHIVLEGIDREIILDSIEFYNPDDNLWHFVPPFPFGCFSVGAVVVNERLYMTGGISDDPEHNVPVNYAHVYDPVEESWMPLSPMLTARHCHGAVHRNGRLYVFGGFTAGEVDQMGFNDCYVSEVYDIDADQWSLLNDLPSIRGGHIYASSAVFHDKIYVLSATNKEEYFLHTFDEETGTVVDEGEPCGPYVHKMITLKVPMPSQYLDELVSPGPTSGLF